MGNTIEDVIAAAKRVQQPQPFDGQEAAMWIALGDARIAMAEALARIAEFTEQGGMCEPDYPSREAEIARECLNRIVKELMP